MSSFDRCRRLLVLVPALLVAGCLNVTPPEEEGTGGSGGGGGTPCPAIGCDLYCEYGFVVGDDGCATCECRPPPEPTQCRTAQDCEELPLPATACAGAWSCDGGVCHYECEQGNGCYGDQDCPEGMRCNAGEVCLPPPGCGGDRGCPAVCYGECVPRQDCPPVACALFCPFGFQRGEDGCEVCRCLDDQSCSDGTECPPGYQCVEDPGGAGPARCEQLGCGCPRLWEPVCSEDGLTYPNVCEAECAGAAIAFRGECQTGCACTDIYAPVCGYDGVTYGNECEARCAGAGVAYPGACEQGCACPASWEPVCGIDGNTYGNECQASCLGVPVAYFGECRSSCFCPDVWAPVCGYDGVTYSNECEAGCAGMEVAYPGECGQGCACTLEYAPVCGTDGRTYGNACQAGCAGAAVAYPGECSCVCPELWAPVCGSDGNTYGNACEAGCANVAVLYEGECQPSCVCPMVYSPVCGVDGVTYGNECEASCLGVPVAYRGECNQGCPAVMCDLFCEQGFAVGPDGCPLCECAQSCACPANYDPVCASDGSTYGNECGAACAGALVDHYGACGAFCGGIAGLPCPRGQQCVLDEPQMPDSGGECVPDGFCRADSDCVCLTDAPCSWELDLPPCAGTVTCMRNACTFVCTP